MSATTTTRRRRRLAGTLPVLTTALVAASLQLPLEPAGAQLVVDSVVFRSGTEVTYVGEVGVANRVNVFLDERGELGITEPTGVTGQSGCRNVNPAFATCGTGVTSVEMILSGGDDTVVAEAALPTLVDAGSGNDTVDMRVAGDSQLTFDGEDGADTMTYANTDRFVTVTLDGVANDGRPGDRDNVSADVENVVGSGFPDRITGSAGRNNITGGPGPDALNGLGGDDSFREGPQADPGDVFSGGPGRDQVDYSARTGGVAVALDGVADDGQAGERDNARSDVEIINGGDGANTLTGNGAANILNGSDGDDRLVGNGGADILSGSVGADTYLGGAGNDELRAPVDRSADTVNCGAGAADVATVERGVDSVSGCESIR